MTKQKRTSIFAYNVYPFFIKYFLKFTGKIQWVTETHCSKSISSLERHSHQSPAGRLLKAPAQAKHELKLNNFKKDTLSSKDDDKHWSFYWGFYFLLCLLCFYWPLQCILDNYPGWQWCWHSTQDGVDHSTHQLQRIHHFKGQQTDENALLTLS